MIAYMNISSRSSMPKLAMEGIASNRVLKMIYNFFAFLKMRRTLPILRDLRIVD